MAGLANPSDYWDRYLFMRTSSSNKNLDYRVVYSSMNFTHNDNMASSQGMSVRCIKAITEEPPTVSLRASELFKVIPLGAKDSIKVSYKSFDSNPATIVWNVPPQAELEVIVADTCLIIRHNTAGDFDWEQLSCTVIDSYGSTTINGAGKYTVTADLGSQGPDLVIGENSYRTYNFPNGIGTWMIDNLKELPADYTHHALLTEGERGYYYKYETSRTACPAGWHLPSASQTAKMTAFALLLEGSAPYNSLYVNRAGYFAGNSSTPRLANTYFWLADGYVGAGGVDGKFAEQNISYNMTDWAFSLRCVKGEN
jgi:hypothetical protein